MLTSLWCEFNTVLGTSTEQRRGIRSRRRLIGFNPPRGTRWVHVLVHNSKVTFVRFRLNQDINCTPAVSTFQRQVLGNV